MSVSIARHEIAVRHPVAFQFPQARPSAPPMPATLPEHLSALRAFSTTQRFARNKTIFHEGDGARDVFHVVSGTVRLCRHTPDGRRHIAEFAMTGDVCGVFDGASQSFTAEAVTDVTVIAYPRSQLDRLAERDPSFRAKVLSHLSTHLLTVQMHGFVLGCQNAKERLASFLLRQAQRAGAIRSGRVDLAMGRQDIADHLGLTIETICRAITTLKNQQLVGVPSTHQIVLRNIGALVELAEGSSLN